METKWWKNADNSLGSASGPDGLIEVPPGATEMTGVDWQAEMDSQVADSDTAVDDLLDDQATADQVDAQAVYDDIVGNHPIAALILAKRIYPPFVP